MENPFAYVQLQTSNLDQAKQFYTQLFGWQTEERAIPGGKYAEILLAGNKIAGIFGHNDPSKPSQWIPYVRVKDIKGVADKARSLGAKVQQEPVQLPDKSWFCWITDPTGTTLGLHQLAAG